MSKRKRKTSAKHGKSGKVSELPVRRTYCSKEPADNRLSEIIREMAQQLLKDPMIEPSEPATMAALMLAGAAWNCAIGESLMRQKHRELIDRIDWEDVPPWKELRSSDTEQLISELVDYKFEAYVNHRPDVIFLEGLPDIPESRPHSSLNS